MPNINDEHISTLRKYGKGFLLVAGCTALACTGIGLFGIPWFTRWMANLDEDSTVKSLRMFEGLSYWQVLGLSKVQVTNLNQFPWNFYTENTTSVLSDILTQPILLTASAIEKIKVYYAFQGMRTIHIDSALALTNIQLHNLKQFFKLIQSLSIYTVDSIVDAIIAIPNEILNTPIISQQLTSLIHLIVAHKITVSEILVLSENEVENLQLLQPYILQHQLTVENAKAFECTLQQRSNLQALPPQIINELIHELPLETALNLSDIQRANVISYYHTVQLYAVNLRIISLKDILNVSKLITVERYQQICCKGIVELVQHGRLNIQEALDLNDIQLYNLKEAMLINDDVQRSGISVNMICTFTHRLTQQQLGKLHFLMSYSSRDMTYGCLVGERILTITQMLDLNATQIDMLRWACIRYLLGNKRELSERVLQLDNPHHIAILKNPLICSLLVNDIITLDRAFLLTAAQAERIYNSGYHELLTTGDLRLGVALLLTEGRLSYPQAMALSSVQQTLLDEASTQILAGHATIMDIIGVLPIPVPPPAPLPPVTISATTYLTANSKLLHDLSTLKTRTQKIVPLTPQEISQYSALIESSDQVPDSEKSREKERLREYQESIICGISKEPVEGEDEPITVIIPISTSKSHHQVYDRNMLIGWVNSQKEKTKHVEDPCTRYPLQNLLRDGRITLGHPKSVIRFIQHVRRVIAFYAAKLTHSSSSQESVTQTPSEAMIKPDLPTGDFVDSHTRSLPIDRRPARELGLAWLSKVEESSITSDTGLTDTEGAALS